MLKFRITGNGEFRPFRMQNVEMSEIAQFRRLQNSQMGYMSKFRIPLNVEISYILAAK